MKPFRHTAAPRRIVALLAAAATLSFAQSASAIAPGSTFTFALIGYNASTKLATALGAGQVATFGTTQTFTAAGYNNQDYTISSSEVVGATTTTDTFTLITPASFLTSKTIDNTAINGLEFDIGTAGSGTGVTSGAEQIDLAGIVASAVGKGSALYSTGSFTLSPTITLGADGMSYSASESFSLNGSATISQASPHEFDLVVSYATPAAAVPETGTWALLLAGLGMVGSVARRRAQRA